jgi:hypothetical protein
VTVLFAQHIACWYASLHHDCWPTDDVLHSDYDKLTFILANGADFLGFPMVCALTAHG